MVTSMILSRYSGEIPDGMGERKISDGPLYPDVVDIIDKCRINPWTRKCISNLQELSMDQDDVRDWIIRAVNEGRYLGSEWCQGTREGVWAACDAYSLVDTAWNENAGKELSCKYYIKFFINRDGTVVMTVSFHLST
ncbi:hypothetical protein BSU01_14445 [Erwinia billingiae]|nr:hypothetical protein [Erwinia billingiae]